MPATRPDDPAYVLKLDGVFSVPVVYDSDCYICTDGEYSQMGLPLCRKCPACVKAGRGDGHIPADDEECTECGFSERDAFDREVDFAFSRRGERGPRGMHQLLSRLGIRAVWFKKPPGMYDGRDGSLEQTDADRDFTRGTPWEDA